MGVFNLFGQNNSGAAILAVEQSRFEAMTRSDSVMLGGLLADDLVYIHSNALKESKSEHIQSIVSGKIVYQSMDRESVNVRLYGNIAISSGVIKVKGVFSGNPFEVKMLYTAVYRKKKRSWQLVNWQSTRLP